MDNSYSGVVLDEPQAIALLYYAIKEGLIDNNPYVGDGFIQTILRNPPMAEAKDNAFEQLVIGGKVYIPFSIPKELGGELIERELISPVPYIEEENMIEIESLDPAVIIAMLRMRGIIISEDEITSYIDDFVEAYKEYIEISNGVFIDEYKSFIYKLLGNDSYYKSLSPELIAKWKTMIAAYEKAKPVIRITKMYSTVITNALKLNALSSLPVYSSANKNIQLPGFADSLERISLLKYTCNKLNSTPIGYNLKQTVEIATSTEAHYYRDKLNSWTMLLKTQELNKIEGVYKDIEKAQSNLLAAKGILQAGALCTCIGVPLSFIQPLNELGIVTTIIGGVCLTTELLKYINKWAMFGKS